METERVAHQIETTVIRSLDDVWPLAALRKEDQAEVAKLGMTAAGAVAASIFGSTRSFAVKIEGRLMCVWGYRRTGLVVDVWLLTTEEVDSHPFAFLRESRRLLNIMLDNLTEIRCEVARDYTKTRRWLERIGFEQGGDSTLHSGFIVYKMGGRVGRA